MVQAKNRAQAAVQNLANSDGSKKRVSAASLLARADSIMQSRDRTTWDDPSKRSVTEAAAKYTESQLDGMVRSEEHTSELQSLMRISYAVFCLKKKQKQHIKQLRQNI